MFWIENAPIYGKSSNVDVKQFIDKHISCSLDVSNEEQTLLAMQSHKH